MELTVCREEVASFYEHHASRHRVSRIRWSETRPPAIRRQSARDVAFVLRRRAPVEALAVFDAERFENGEVGG